MGKNLQSTRETRLNQKIQLKRNQNLRHILRRMPVRRAKKRPQVMKNRSIPSCDKLECYYLKFYLQHCTPIHSTPPTWISVSQSGGIKMMTVVSQNLQRFLNSICIVFIKLTFLFAFSSSEIIFYVQRMNSHQDLKWVCSFN